MHGELHVIGGEESEFPKKKGRIIASGIWTAFNKKTA